MENKLGVLKKVVMEFEQEDGAIIRRTLKDEQAKKWDDLVSDVCKFANIHSANPDWTEFKWEEESIQGK